MPQTVPEPTTEAPDAVTHTLALLRPWIEYVPQQQRRLGIFISLAVAIHVAAFVFIRIDESRAELRHQTRTHVTVEPPQAVAVNGAASENIWDQLTDPRLYILPLHPDLAVTAEPPPLALDSNLGSGQFPDPVAPAGYKSATPAIAPIEQQVGETMTPPREPFSYDETQPAMAKKTTWVVDDTLAQRQPAGFPDLPSPTSDTDLSPTQLRVAVAPNGTVQHVMVEESSAGDLGASIAKDLDQQAVLAAGKIRFKPVDQPGVVWGRVTVFWQYAAKPREEVVPTPPSTGQ
jgi:hypothetical protein